MSSVISHSLAVARAPQVERVQKPLNLVIDDKGFAKRWDKVSKKTAELINQINSAAMIDVVAPLNESSVKFTKYDAKVVQHLSLQPWSYIESVISKLLHMQTKDEIRHCTNWSYVSTVAVTSAAIVLRLKAYRAYARNVEKEKMMKNPFYVEFFKLNDVPDRDFAKRKFDQETLALKELIKVNEKILNYYAEALADLDRVVKEVYRKASLIKRISKATLAKLREICSSVLSYISDHTPTIKILHEESKSKIKKIVKQTVLNAGVSAGAGVGLSATGIISLLSGFSAPVAITGTIVGCITTALALYNFKSLRSTSIDNVLKSITDFRISSSEFPYELHEVSTISVPEDMMKVRISEYKTNLCGLAKKQFTNTELGKAIHALYYRASNSSIPMNVSDMIVESVIKAHATTSAGFNEVDKLYKSAIAMKTADPKFRAVYAPVTHDSRIYVFNIDSQASDLLLARKLKESFMNSFASAQIDFMDKTASSYRR
jgi:hypothetical protein